MVRSMLMLVVVGMLAACGASTRPPASSGAISTAVTAGSLQISDVWVRAATADSGTSVSAAYMTITNTGGVADRLLKVQGDLANTYELHSMTVTNGVMRMDLLNAIDLPAQSEVQINSRGYHVMLIGIRHDLTPGERVALTLQFEQAGTLQVLALVRAA
jgi:copper(I)-binding protein